MSENKTTATTPTVITVDPILPHPFETYESFNLNPPIPLFNYIIDSRTEKIIEDKTEQP